MGMPGRKYSAGSAYRYGFNGKENDNEVKGEGNQQDYGMRIYDPRLVRFLSVDPLTPEYPELTPYQFASNSPIDAIDLDGLERYYYKLALDEKSKKPILSLQKIEKGWSFLGFSYTYDEKKVVEYNGQTYTFNTGWYDWAKQQFADFTEDPEGTLSGDKWFIQSDEEILSNYAVEAGTAVIVGTVITNRSSSGNRKQQTKTNESPESNTNKQATAANKGNTQAEETNTATSSSGRSGKQARIKAMKDDSKESSANRGWVRNEERRIKSGNGSKNYRMPNNGRKSPGRLAKDKGLELAHPHNSPASKGGSYKKALIKNHSEHKVETRLHKKAGRY